ncbi:MAG: hypothetical protein R3257_06310, partial [bacterium]|nr:hypothetical protein [bacterium]
IEDCARKWRSRYLKNKGLPRAILAAKPRVLRQAILEGWLRQYLPSTRNLGRLVQAIDEALDFRRKLQQIPLANKLSLEINSSTIRIKKRKSSPLRAKN